MAVADRAEQPAVGPGGGGVPPRGSPPRQPRPPAPPPPPAPPGRGRSAASREGGTMRRGRRPAATVKGKRKDKRRQAQLTLARVEPWSVMKFSFVVSVVAFIVLFVAVALLYMVLSSLGVFE